jgi:hypothetical protein
MVVVVMLLLLLLQTVRAKAILIPAGGIKQQHRIGLPAFRPAGAGLHSGPHRVLIADQLPLFNFSFPSLFF